MSDIETAKLIRLLRRNTRTERQANKRHLARVHKLNPTEAEIALLERLRQHDIPVWFSPQFTFCGYILDFFCRKERICIEVDGPSHWTSQGRAKDATRDAILQAANVKVLRFSNDQVLGDIESVAASVLAAVGWIDRKETAEWFASLPDSVGEPELRRNETIP